jgi:hypothetical protein
MNQSESFSDERFMSLAGSALVSYTEPFVNRGLCTIPMSVYEVLVSNLTRLDEEHVVYALEICMALKPDEFANLLVGFLAHADSAVSCTAFRLLKKIAPNRMRADLVRKIVTTPVVDLFSRDVRTGNPIRIGTNKEFIRDLVATFGSTLERGLDLEDL